MSETPKGDEPKDVAKAADNAPEHPEGVYVEGEGLAGTANKGFPSTAGLTGDDAPVQYTNVLPGGPQAEAHDIEPVPVGERWGMFGATQGADTSGYGGLQRPILFPGEAARPYGGWYDEVVDTLVDATGGEDLVERVVVDRGELTLFVRRDDLRPVMQALRDDPDLRFEMCMSVSGVHWPSEEGRELHVVYELLSITHDSRRLRVEVTAPDADPHIPSVVGIYPAADWHERETWDMFGVVFDDRPDLTRILMPDDWPGHPQRKDYPLGGVPVEYKGGTVPPPDERRSYT